MNQKKEVPIFRSEDHKGGSKSLRYVKVLSQKVVLGDAWKREKILKSAECREKGLGAEYRRTHK